LQLAFSACIVEGGLQENHIFSPVIDDLLDCLQVSNLEEGWAAADLRHLFDEPAGLHVCLKIDNH
jgi:hypothetical protein